MRGSAALTPCGPSWSLAPGVIYDSDKPDARLIGIEYVVNEEVFIKLPEEEKKYWHRRVELISCPRSP
jgi:hypothetical protein